MIPLPVLSPPIIECLLPLQLTVLMLSLSSLHSSTLCTMAPCAGDPRCYLFDSHACDYGDGRPGGASVLTFRHPCMLLDYLRLRFPKVWFQMCDDVM